MVCRQAVFASWGPATPIESQRLRGSLKKTRERNVPALGAARAGDTKGKAMELKKCLKTILTQRQKMRILKPDFRSLEAFDLLHHAISYILRIS